MLASCAILDDKLLLVIGSQECIQYTVVDRSYQDYTPQSSKRIVDPFVLVLATLNWDYICTIMNDSYETWTPYPNMKCLIGKEVIISLNIPCCLLSCILNGVIFVVIGFKVSFTDRSILSLTIADLLTSFVGQPMLIAVYAIELLDQFRLREVSLRLQRVTFFLNCITCSASVISISVVIINRYIQIKSPLRYEAIITGKRLIRICILIWLFAFLSSFSAWVTGISLYVYYVCILSGLFAELLMITYVNINIIIITRRIVRDARHSRPVPNKAMKTVVIIFILFTLSVLPFGITGLTYFLRWPSVAWKYRSDYDCESRQQIVHTTLYFYTILLYHTNAAFNSLVYTLRDTRVKSALKSFIRNTAPAITVFYDRFNTNRSTFQMHRGSSVLPLRSRSNIHRSSTAESFIALQRTNRSETKT